MVLVGNDHHYIGAISNSIANVLRDAGRYEESEKWFLKAFENQKTTLPSGHLSKTNPMTGYGMLLCLTGQAAKAEPLLREAISVRLNQLGENHYRTAVSQSALGECLTSLKQFEEAETLLVQAFATLSEHFGPDHNSTIRTKVSLNKLYKKIDKDQLL